MKKAFALLLACALLLVACAQAETVVSGPWTYKLQRDGSATITAYKGTGTSINVPQKLDGHTVRAIDKQVFKNNQQLTQATIPEGIVSLGTLAFDNCQNLRLVNLPGSLTTVGENPFARCASLGASGVRIGDKNTVLEVEDGALYSKRDGKLICVFHTPARTSFTVRNGTRTVGGYAFFSMKTLEQVNLPESLTEIGTQAFVNCSKLRNLVIPASVTTIKSKPFNNCEDLTVGVTRGSAADAWCTAEAPAGEHRPGRYFVDAQETRTAVTQETRTAAAPSEYVWEQLADGSVRITDYTGSDKELTVPDTLDGHPVTEIGPWAFAGLSVTSVSLPEGIRVIGERAFNLCQQLTSIRVPKSVEKIGSLAFHTETTGVVSLTVVVYEGSYAESYCRSEQVSFWPIR